MKYYPGFKNCLDCGIKLRDYASIRCNPCNGKYRRSEKSFNWKGGIPHCPKCNKKMSRQAKQCRKCLGSPNKKEKIILNCIRCNKEFTVRLSVKNIRKYCSRKCFIKPLLFKKCPYCTKEFSQKHSGKQKYCSVICGIKDHKGNKHWDWKGGVTPIRKSKREEFRRSMQKIVFERDNYTCQMCGIRGVDLQVDHIQSWSEYVELRFKLDNCRTLCAKCHYQITFGKPMPEGVRGWGHNMLKGVD